MKTRRTTSADYDQILPLLDRAFAPSISEAELVRNMRDRGKISLDMVIEQAGRILGYICFTRAYDSLKNPIGLHLAPLAVLPGRQRRGLGRRLILAALGILDAATVVYVLGDPEYYTRSGFRIDRTQQCIFDPEGNHFLVRSAGPLPARAIGYEQEFYDLAGIPEAGGRSSPARD